MATPEKHYLPDTFHTTSNIIHCQKITIDRVLGDLSFDLSDPMLTIQPQYTQGILKNMNAKHFTYT